MDKDLNHIRCALIEADAIIKTQNNGNSLLSIFVALKILDRLEGHGFTKEQTKELIRKFLDNRHVCGDFEGRIQKGDTK